MGKITKITQETFNRFVNLFHLETINKVGKPGNYYVSSRAKTVGELKITTRDMHPDAVTIFMLYPGNDPAAPETAAGNAAAPETPARIVLVRQYRFPVDDYVYELPAGLVEKGEDPLSSAIREAKEETGLTFTPLEVDDAYKGPFFMTIGMTDECNGMVYGYASGEISDKYMEASEEIEVVLADKEEAKRILREERLTFSCAASLMHFIHDEEPFGFLREIS